MLDRGEMVEFDTGDVLLSNGKSHLSAMVAQTGAAEAGYLRSLAIKAKEQDPMMPSFQPLYSD